MLAALRGPGLKLARGLRRRALGSLQMRGQPLRGPLRRCACNHHTQTHYSTALQAADPADNAHADLPRGSIRKDPSACCGVTLGVREFSNDENQAAT